MGINLEGEEGVKNQSYHHHDNGNDRLAVHHLPYAKVAP